MKSFDKFGDKVYTVVEQKIGEVKMKLAKKVFIIVLMIWMIYSINSYAATGKITTDGARIRREANTSSDVLTVVYQGDTIEIIEQSGEWYKIKYGEGTGYIRGDLMEISGEVEALAKPETTTEQEVSEEPQTEESEILSEETQEPVAEENVKQEEIVSQTGEKQVTSDIAYRIVPSLFASHLGEIKAGTKVTVIKVLNAWSCIKYENSKTAWVPSRFLESIEQEQNPQETQEPDEPSTKIGYVNVSAAIIRKGPSTSAEIITEWRRNQQVEIIGEDGEWYKILFQGEEAYIAKRLISDTVTAEASRGGQVERNVQDTLDDTQKQDEEISAESQIQENEDINIDEEIDIEMTSVYSNTENQDNVEEMPEPVVEEPVQESAPAIASSKGDEIVATAKQYLGCSYVYGGSGPSSFDCSGFTQYIYKQFGVSLAHSAVTQANSGTYVAKENLQPGDLVIFRDWDNASIGHCGIYIGGGQFIHAANSKRGVVTDTLNSGYYYERYVSGRRLV